MLYHYAIKNISNADPNIHLYRSAVEAYAELDRRERYGVPATLQSRNEWDCEVMAYASTLVSEQRAREGEHNLCDSAEASI